MLKYNKCTYIEENYYFRSFKTFILTSYISVSLAKSLNTNHG